MMSPKKHPQFNSCNAMFTERMALTDKHYRAQGITFFGPF